MGKLVLFFGVGAAAVGAACGTSSAQPIDTLDQGLDAGPRDSGASSSSGSLPTPLPPPGDGGQGSLVGDASIDGPPPVTTMDPQTCDQAAAEHSYVGCDYWPTVVANTVWSVFDFAVVVANAGQNTANVTVTGPSATQSVTTVPPGELAKIDLPWVAPLKGPDADNCGGSNPLAASVGSIGGAYHLVSNVPVTVYQFNALEYVGGTTGKWSACPGNGPCSDPQSQNYRATLGCYSFSNDASLLLPSTAMTGNYRVVGHEGTILTGPPPGQPTPNDAYIAITGTRDGTNVAVKLSSTGRTYAGTITGPNGAGTGTAIPAAAPGGTLTFTLNAGDVVELAGSGGSDLSGSQVQASAPVQVITGMPCVRNPPLAQACDHVEESVFPAETLGKDYVVVRPAGPTGAVVPHDVRIFGNVDGTHLTYSPATPPGCPTTINAGQVVECGSPACPQTIDVTQALGTTCGETTQDFEVTGDQPFSVVTFTLGASVVDPAGQNGDPAQSLVTAVEQYRSRYVFLAPSDYPVSYVGIVAKAGTSIALDGQPVSSVPQAVGAGFSAYRLRLGAGQAGAHTLTASEPVGIQVVGYGLYTSYMYPGGLDLVHIAPPPPPIQ